LKGGAILAVQPVEPGTTDFRSILTKIKSAQPDAIYAPLYTRSAGLMIKQARELRLKQQILGADVYGTPELVEAGGTAVDGVLYTTFGEYRGTEYQDFSKRYKLKFGIDAETYATYCYDAIKIALYSVRKLHAENKKITGQNIRDVLLSIKTYSGATGETSFNGHNSAQGKTFDRMVVQGGVHKHYEELKTK
jgi:branched-chain amino acid transport system substrate-binding protein